jgi:hypothetical protein
MARFTAITCGYPDEIGLDRLRHDPLMKIAVGRCPESGAPLAYGKSKEGGVSSVMAAGAES